MKMNIYSLILLSSLATPAFSDLAKPTELGVVKVEEVEKSWMTVESTAVNFIKGGSALSEAETLNLKAVLEKAGRGSPIGRILVVSWADKEGLKSGEKSSDFQIELAQKRAEIVKKLLTDLSSKPVQSFNMASDSGWLAKTFQTRDAKLKDAVKFPDATSDQYRGLAEILEQQGGLGKGVVVIQKEDVEMGTKPKDSDP